jgi:acyl-CoA synthetase (AMP-forming)/AMP-acid ligase II
VPAVLPFFHIFGLTMVLLGSLAHGCKIVTLPKFEPKSFFKLLDQHQVLFVPSDISTACFNPQYNEALHLQWISPARG